MEIISTNWVSSQVIIRPSDGLRIYIDAKPLNRVLERSHQFFTLEDILLEILGAEIFTGSAVKNAS